ncbi:UNVERIFIED_CONTAM: hypothetical protein GTU68_028824 [Idotea baltica]|nr:hypothetical protein [Idotea baltica]
MKGHITETKAERAVLVGLIFKEQTEERVDEYLEELAFLAQTAGAKILKKFKQKLTNPDKRTFVGKGKLEEIKMYVEAYDADMVIFDDDLTPTQAFNIEKELEIKIIDRSYLILDIFASRAQSAQAKTQVELAQMQYLLPRLRGLWTHLERQQGGIGTRGPGEKEIETDRRIVNKTITNLKNKLKVIDKQNETRRKRRGELIRVALVGYTNVGKSTIMNLISKSDVFAENKLFATLDTTVRKVVFDNTPFLLSDTVGFIRKLPHSLIESFKSTLDEAIESDILLHVVDFAHPQAEDQLKVVQKTLQELKADDKPIITVFNKTDLYEQRYFDEYLAESDKQDIIRETKERWHEVAGTECLFISAINKDNLTEFRTKLIEMVREQYAIRYPYKTQYF